MGGCEAKVEPTDRNVNLDIQRAVLVANLVEGLKNDFSHVIANELFARGYKTVSALPFPCLIMDLCRHANIFLYREVDNEVRASHRQDIERMKDDSKYEMQVNKPLPY